MKQPGNAMAGTRDGIPIISFFSGCGGFDSGFAAAGFEIRMALDVDPVAVKTYNHNARTAVCKVADLGASRGADLIKLCEDMVPAKPPRGVIGGAPCQTFSNGNVHFREDDSRHMLPRKYACILRDMNAKYDLDFFVFENVKGITSSKHQKEYKTIKRLFSRAGFILHEGEMDAADFGVAQHRRRVFLVGFNRMKWRNVSFAFPKAQTQTPRTVEKMIKGLPEPLLFRRGTVVDDIPHHPNHWAMFPRSGKFSDGSLTPGNSDGRSFRVLAWDRPSWTVAYGNREVHVHPEGRRRLSVYEAMLLQGFPKSFEMLGTLSDQIRQVSDAIPPQIGKALGQAIYQVLYSSGKGHEGQPSSDEGACTSTVHQSLPGDQNAGNWHRQQLHRGSMP